MVTDRLKVLLVSLMLAVALAGLPPGCLADETSTLRVTLLGTGTPTPEPDRAGPSVLVEAEHFALLFDAGRGTVVRLTQAGVRLSSLDAVFLTHLHSDHVTGLPDLLLTSRLPADYGLRTDPLPLYGPTGTAAMARGIEVAFAADVAIRAQSQKLAASSARFAVEEFETGRLVFERSGIRVAAFEVDHGESVKPAFGYRVDVHERSVVISGDTSFSDSLIHAAEDSDLLIHEVAHIPASYIEKYPSMRNAIRIHSSPQQAGAIFRRVKPKLAVLTHLALIGGSTPSQVVAAMRETYRGPLIVGEDLMTFEVADDIAIYRQPAQ